MDTTQILDTLTNVINPMAIVIAVLAGILFVLGFILVRSILRKQDDDSRIIDQVVDGFESELAGDKGKKKNPIWGKWCDYWDKHITRAGIRIPLLTRENIGSRMAIFFGVIFVSSIVLFAGQIIAGVVITVLIFVVIAMLSGFLSDRRSERISGQVPGFLQSMRASVQNNALPKNALLAAIKDSPDGLYEELRPLEAELNAGGNLKDTLIRFSNTTSIEELQFLMSCIILSVDKGNNLDPQLGIIQGIVEARRRRRRHIKQAVSEVMPTIAITSAVLPGIFIFMYVADTTAQDYWFKSLIAWIVFIIAIAIWWGGLYMGKRQIDAVKKLG